jgi:magnesium chelatase subunit D
VDSSAGIFTAQLKPALSHAANSGRWRESETKHSAFRHGAARADRTDGSVVAWAATVRAAALHQRGRGWTTGRLLLQGDDLRFWPRRGPGGCLLLFVVDTSGSMAAWRRMRQTKAAILALLLQAYQHRDQVALLAFRGEGSELVLRPTRGLAAARRALEELPAGGTTPLAHGLGAACRFIGRQERRQSGRPIWTVILTDGRANSGTADPWQEALAQARALAATGSDCLVVDTETGWPRFGQAAQLARAMSAACVPLEQVLGKARTISLSDAS